MTAQGCSDMIENISDLFERLADDILISIITMLPFKEAARTSVLSRRWYHLWTFHPGPLNFSPKRRSIMEYRINLLADRREFVGRVNKIMSQHRARTVSEMIIYNVNHDIPQENEDDIDGWLKFAREKQIRKLDLHFGCYTCNAWRYEFPPKGDSYFTSLQELILSGVNVRGGDLDQILSSCPNLEELTVANSECNRTLRASAGTSLKLKRLTIRACLGPRRVEVEAQNLTFFGYSGYANDIVFINTKKVCDLYLGYDCILSDRPVDPSIIPQLDGLTLDATWQDLFPVRPFARFTNITRLQLKLPADGSTEVIECLPLVMASPMLSSLAIELQRFYKCPSPQTFELDSIGNVMRERVGETTHRNLKIITIEGFLGHESETQLVICLARYAISLSILTITLGNLIGTYRPALELRFWSLQQVEKSKAYLPHHIQLEILEKFC